MGGFCFELSYAAISETKTVLIGKGSMTDAQARLLELAMNRASDNVWISILGSIVIIFLFGIYILSRIYYIIEIQRRTTADFMNFVDDVLDKIHKTSSKRAMNLLSPYLDSFCVECVHPKDSFNGSLSIALLYGTKQRIKQRWNQNGFLKLAKDSERFEHEVEILGKRLRNKSQQDMELHANGLKEFIHKTNDERFTEASGVKELTEIMKEGIALKKQERKDIIKVLFFWRTH